MVGVETLHSKLTPFTVFKLGTVKNEIIFGGNFGFVNTGDSMIIGPFARYGLLKKGSLEFFTEGSLHFIKVQGLGLTASITNTNININTGTSQSGLLLSALGGFSLRPFTATPLDFTISFGFLLDTVSETELSTVQDTFGNFGINYWF